MTEIYKNAPLIEAVFEIRFPPQLRISEGRSLFYDKVSHRFPVIKVPPLGQSEYPALEPYKFETPDGKKSLQLAINRFSFHDNLYSAGFAAFREEALEIANSLCAVYGIEDLRRTGLRYVNHIPIVRVGELIPIQRYLNLGFALPKPIGNQFALFGVVFVTQLGAGRLRVLSEFREIQQMPKTEIIVLDFDYYLEKSLKSSALKEYLEASHAHTKQVFLDLITPEYLDVMRGASNASS